MKTFSRLLTIIIVTASLALFGGCGKKQVPPYVPVNNAGMAAGKNIQYPAPASSQETGPSVESLNNTGGANGNTLNQASTTAAENTKAYKELHGRSSAQLLPIYFDFDQAVVRSDQMTQLEQNADYLKKNPDVKVIVEGNCDERGTNEYNLALGERRALNGKKFLVELGVKQDRIRTISYGEERPLFTGHNEFAWSHNRRDDFVIE